MKVQIKFRKTPHHKIVGWNSHRWTGTTRFQLNVLIIKITRNIIPYKHTFIKHFCVYRWLDKLSTPVFNIERFKKYIDPNPRSYQ